MFAQIERKRIAGVVLNAQEEAFLEEDREAREIDPYAEFESYMGDVFTALKAGTIPPENVENMLATMLQRQRRIYSLKKQQDALAEERRKLDND